MNIGRDVHGPPFAKINWSLNNQGVSNRCIRSNAKQHQRRHRRPATPQQRNPPPPEVTAGTTATITTMMTTAHS